MVDVFQFGENSSETIMINNSTDNTTSGMLNENTSGLVNTDGLSLDISQLLKILFRVLRLVIGFTGILLNSFILEALGKVHPRVLKSKPFIQNAIISDIVMTVGLSVQIIPSLLEAFGRENPKVILSAESVANQIGYLCMYIQAFASVLLAGDRMYAVIRPMKYHTVGYTTLAKILIFAVAWLLAFGITLLGVILPFTVETYRIYPLYLKLMTGVKVYTLAILPFVIISLNTFTFILYIALFVTFVVQRRMNRAVAKSTSEKAGTTVSLTLTYFFIHTSSLLLYLPGPIMKALRDNKVLPSSPGLKIVWSLLNKLFVALYMCNTLVNPLILGFRVRLVRENLNTLLKKSPGAGEITNTTS